MIPGPVTGRVPIDPGAAQRQLTEAVGEAEDSGTSFADLLAAMLAPGAAGAQLQAPASESAEAVFERLDAAEVFNETGLFRGAAPLPSAEAGASVAEAPVTAPVQAPAPAPSPQAELQIALAPPGGEAAPVPAVTSTAADQLAADGHSAAAPGAPLSRIAYRAMLALRGQPAAPPAAPSPGAEAGGEGSGRVSPRTATLVAQIVAAKAGAAAAQVSVQAVEGGINVMARVDKLSREERDRLRAEIGELLARHGFGSAGIWLNGEAWPLPQGEEN